MNPKKGLISEYPTQHVRLRGSFRVTTAAVDAVRTGKGCKWFTAARTAAGQYTVTLDPNIAKIPRQLTYGAVTQHNTDAAPGATTLPYGGYISGLSIDTTAKTFIVVTMLENAANAPSVTDPEDGTWVSFDVEGPEIADFVDAI